MFTDTKKMGTLPKFFESLKMKIEVENKFEILITTAFQAQYIEVFLKDNQNRIEVRKLCNCNKYIWKLKMERVRKEKEEAERRRIEQERRAREELAEKEREKERMRVQVNYVLLLNLLIFFKYYIKGMQLIADGKGEEREGRGGAKAS